MLTSCKNCGDYVAVSSTACPHCGYGKENYRPGVVKLAVWIVIGAALANALGMFS